MMFVKEMGLSWLQPDNVDSFCFALIFASSTAREHVVHARTDLDCEQARTDLILW
jgi:hypothetical protein